MRLFVYLALGFYFSKLAALPSVVPDPNPCLLILETHFFQEGIVNQALSLYNVRQELWLPINQRLKQKNFEIPERMKVKTAYMVPNPIEYPMNKAVTAKILKEVLYEIFMEVVREYRVGASASPEYIFDYIFSQNLPKFIDCFGPAAEKLRPKFI